MESNNTLSLEEAVAESVKQTFADMAFIDVETVIGTSPDFHTGQLIHISFSEPIEGEMVLFLSKECKMKIVENIYGKDWTELDPTAVDDCLLEMLNVIAGNFLNTYCGYRSKHNLSLPRLIFDLEEIHDKNEAQLFYFDAEDAPLEISLCVKEK